MRARRSPGKDGQPGYGEAEHDHYTLHARVGRNSKEYRSARLQSGVSDLTAEVEACIILVVTLRASTGMLRWRGHLNSRPPIQRNQWLVEQRDLDAQPTAPHVLP